MTHTLEHLDWDSEFFGLKTGRVSGTDTTDIRQALLIAKEQNFQLVYAYSENPLSQNVLEEFGGLDVGGQMTFSKTLSEKPATQELNHGISLYEDLEPTHSLLKLALLSGHLSRFQTDTRLPAGSYERMYEQWLRNSLEAGESGAVFISGTPSQANGLITASWHGTRCNVELLAVDATAHGRGIGSSLLKAVEVESAKRNAVNMHINTQAANHQARGFYLKNDYSAIRSSFLYHFFHKPKY